MRFCNLAHEKLSSNHYFFLFSMKFFYQYPIYNSNLFPCKKVWFFTGEALLRESYWCESITIVLDSRGHMIASTHKTFQTFVSLQKLMTHSLRLMTHSLGNQSLSLLPQVRSDSHWSSQKEKILLFLRSSQVIGPHTGDSQSGSFSNREDTSQNEKLLKKRNLAQMRHNCIKEIPFMK